MIILKKVLISIVSIFLVLGLSGCGQAQNHNYGHDHDGTIGTHSMTNKAKTTIDTYDHKMNTNSHLDSRKHQSMLTQHVRGIEGVTDSTVLVNDDNIIVGLDVANEADRKKIEEKVRNVLLKDQNGQTVHVTSDSRFHERIRAINKQMSSTNGQPLNDMTNDIKILLDDIGKTFNRAIK